MFSLCRQRAVSCVRRFPSFYVVEFIRKIECRVSLSLSLSLSFSFAFSFSFSCYFFSPLGSLPRKIVERFHVATMLELPPRRKEFPWGSDKIICHCHLGYKICKFHRDGAKIPRTLILFEFLYSRRWSSLIYFINLAKIEIAQARIMPLANCVFLAIARIWKENTYQYNYSFRFGATSFCSSSPFNAGL